MSTKKTAKQYTPIPFFPTQRNILNFTKRHTRRMQAVTRLVTFRLKQSIRATLLSYGLLACVWYNVTLVWQWQRMSATFAISTAGALGPSLRRVGGIIADVYAHAFTTNVPILLLLALVAAPLAHSWFWKSLPAKWGVSDDAALAMVATMLLATHIAVGAGIFIIDAALLRTLVL